MKPIKGYVKRKVYLKALGFLSLPIIVFLLVMVVILDIVGVAMIDSERVNNDEYITALEKKKDEIEDKRDVNLELIIYYSLDNTTRTKPYEEDNHIYVKAKDIACFIKNDNQVEVKDKQRVYDCLNYDDKQIREFEYHYKLFKETSDYVETEDVNTTGSFGYPIKEPYVKTAGFNSGDSVHNGHHNGVDYVPLSNEAIISSTNGKVIEATNTCDKYGGYLGNTCGGGFGNHIVVATEINQQKYHITYGHMSDIKAKVNDKVKQGQIIGKVGNSGNSTGKHLHLQIEKEVGGTYKPINPEPLLNQTNLSTDKEEILKRAKVDKKDYKAVDFIVSHESSWNYKAVNSSSGAYGLCQALPGTKMQSAGNDWKTNPVTQMKWCDNYAKSRYGSWQKAQDFWQKNEWW